MTGTLERVGVIEGGVVVHERVCLVLKKRDEDICTERRNHLEIRN